MHLFTIEHVLTDAECDAMIARAEAAAFDTATINGYGEAKVDLRIRNNDRVILDDVALAADLWARVQAQIPPLLRGRQAIGLNERFRFYRYTAGQQFDWHFDGAYTRDNGERSLLTFMVYLSDGYTGGETSFEDRDVRGRKGEALVFTHHVQHRGAPVQSGTKYVLRSDVMYSRVGQFRTGPGEGGD